MLDEDKNNVGVILVYNVDNGRLKCKSFGANLSHFQSKADDHTGPFFLHANNNNPHVNRDVVDPDGNAQVGDYTGDEDGSVKKGP